ncbi:MAG: type III-A CRISPR-associated RAMP protein Csm5 [archaeon]|nr:type III-A CRISPR-associated RAMP protein Csm5 [archaeon]MCP8314836.1 type III-A CRISPR-associated RAMP protein Csm5 [archaeon]
MSQLVETHNYTIETISPIHIGSGEKLFRTDYVIHGGRLYVINIDRLIDSLKAEQAKIFSQLIQKGNISIALQSLNVKPNDYIKYAKYVIPCDFQLGQKLQTHIKDIDYKPYIPGSSIKGSIRTAICYNLFAIPKERERLIQEVFKRSHSEKAISEFIESIFGSEDGKRSPHYDVMKFLRISDSKSLNPNSMEIQKIEVINRESPSRYRKTGIKIDAEVIKAGFSTSGKLAIDKTLYQKTYLKYADEFPNYKILTSIDMIISYINKFTSDLINKELDFARKYNIILLQNFYSDLKKNHLEKLDKNRFLLRVGWGSGYLATTLGMLLQSEKQLFERIRRHLPRGLREPFSPISRRLVIQQNTFIPLGWVKVTIE